MHRRIQTIGYALRMPSKGMQRRDPITSIMKARKQKVLFQMTKQQQRYIFEQLFGRKKGMLKISVLNYIVNTCIRNQNSGCSSGEEK